MFENQTEEKEEEEEVIFQRDDKEYWCALRIVIDQFQFTRAKKQSQVVYLYVLQWCK